MYKYIKQCIKFLLPIWLGIIICFVLYASQRLDLVLVILGYTFPPTMFLGRFVVTPFIYTVQYYEAIITFVLCDTLSAMFIIWNFDILAKLPCIGKIIIKSETNGKKILHKYKWIKTFSHLGLFLFVAAPFYGTNAITGSIIGKLMGFESTNLFIIIIAGAFVGALIITLPIYGIVFLLIT